MSNAGATRRCSLVVHKQVVCKSPQLHVARLLHEVCLRRLALELRVLDDDNVRAEAGPVHSVEDRELRALSVEAPEVHVRDAKRFQQRRERPAGNLRQRLEGARRLGSRRLCGLGSAGALRRRTSSWLTLIFGHHSLRNDAAMNSTMPPTARNSTKCTVRGLRRQRRRKGSG